MKLLAAEVCQLRGLIQALRRDLPRLGLGQQPAGMAGQTGCVLVSAFGSAVEEPLATPTGHPTAEIDGREAVLGR